jgi:hypothetical protein
MRSVIFISAAALTVASCTEQPGTPSDSTAFARELAGLTAGPPQTCIPSWPSTNIRVIDRQTLAYDQGKTTWVNRLKAPCPAVEPLNTIIVEPKLGTQYCRGDHIRGREPGAIIAGPTCFLSDWVPYRRP